MESWHNSSFESRESALISRSFGVQGAFVELLCLNWCSSRLEMGGSVDLWSCLKEVKPFVVCDVERRIALEKMQWKRASPPVDLGYTDLFDIPAVTSVSF